MKILSKIFFLFLILPVIVSACSQKVKIKRIKENPDKYDKQYISTEGYIKNIKKKTSKKGNKYTTFYITDKENNSLKVFMWGWKDIEKQKIEKGDKVKVEGIFRKVKYVGKYRFFNEIEAKTVKKKEKEKHKGKKEKHKKKKKKK